MLQRWPLVLHVGHKCKHRISDFHLVITLNIYGHHVKTNEPPLNHGFSSISTFCCSEISNPFLNPLFFDLSKYELTVLVNAFECRLVFEEVLARSTLGGNLTRALFVVLLDVLLGWLRLSWTQVSSRKRTANGTRHTRAPEYDNEHEH